MNAYTTTGQAGSQPRDFSAGRPVNRFLISSCLAALEWQRDCHAEAEVDWLLKHDAVTAQVRTSFVSRLRQTIGTLLVRARVRLAPVPEGGDAPEPAPVTGTLGTSF